MICFCYQLGPGEEHWPSHYGGFPIEEKRAKHGRCPFHADLTAVTSRSGALLHRTAWSTKSPPERALPDLLVRQHKAWIQILS